MKAFKDVADRCRTPKHFRSLLEQHLRRLIPYSSFAATWGSPETRTLSYIFHYKLPLNFVRWYLTTGAQWNNPIFQDRVQSKRSAAYVWADEARRLNVAETNPEWFRRMYESGMEYAVVGGPVSPIHYIAICAVMPSEESARHHLPIFEEVLPWIVEASQRAYPRTLLTARETAVLTRRAHGELGKQIAAAEGVTERTVRKHLENIKKKLYTDDLLNAVVIASHSGMIPFEK
jgi:DNA-binding CsgD family transcriptional regulator